MFFDIIVRMKTINNQSLNTNESLQKQVTLLQLKLDESEKTIVKNKNELEKKDDTIKSLNYQLYLFRNAKFGRKSEKFDDSIQMRLFDEAEEVNASEEEQEIVTYTRKKRGARKSLPKNLPFVEVIHDIDECDKQCDCGCELTHISEDITEKLDILPQVTYRVIHIKKKYACKSCEETIKTASLPKQPFPKCMATAGLVAAIIDAKFNRHLPLYRQEDMFKSMGMKVSRATLSNWVIKAADLLKPLVGLLHQGIKQYDIAYADETTLQVIKQSKAKNYMWLFIGGPPDKQSYVYQYHPTREEVVASSFFDGFSGYLHADCYRAYINLDGKLIKHVACWAHARRYFADIVKTNKKKKGKANEAIDIIAKLYAIEKNFKEQNASAELIYQHRQQESKIILDDFKHWLVNLRPKVPPKTPLGKAIAYSLNHWGALNQYIEDGRLNIDNNLAERGIKPFVIGRKNWLFNFNERGANAASVLYSLIQTCKANNVDVFAYLKFALNGIIHCKSDQDHLELLPFNCDKTTLASQRDIPELIIPAK